jgi:MFS family permease
VRYLSHLRLMAVDVTPLRVSPAYRWLWTGDVFVTLGRQIPNVAIPFQVYALTGSTLMVGLVSLAQLVPLIAGSLVGGVVVDAFDRRSVIASTQAGLMLLAVGLAWNAQQERPALWLIFVLAIAQAVLSGFDSPARRAALPNVVGLELLTSALALQQIVSNLSKLVVPALTGLLIAAFGVSPVFWIYAGTFVIGLLTASRLPSLRPEGGGRKAGWSSLVEGLSFVGHRPIVRSIFLVDISAMVFGLPRALFPAIGLEVLGGTAATVGLLYSAPGAGALLGALTSGWLRRVERIGRAILVSVGIYGLAIVGFGASRWLVLSLLCLVVSGMADMVSAVLRATLLQLTTPDPLRGRVISVNKAVVSGGPLLGDTRAGLLSTVASPVVSIVSGGIGCLIGLALIAAHFPGLRHAVLARDGRLLDDRSAPAPIPTGGGSPSS